MNAPRIYRDGSWQPAERPLAEEVPVAITLNGETQAVMMATPADLTDFARGFVLTEGFVDRLSEIEGVEILPAAELEDRAGGCTRPTGIEARLWLAPAASARLAARRRRMTGPVGCGLCGIDSLAEALRPLPRLEAGLHLRPAQVGAAMAALARSQPLHDATRAMHAAGFWRPGKPLIVREDVGRHNALDKLAGALAAQAIDPATGLLLLTSRISVDMVQKAAMIGAPLLLAASAPTTLAVAEAEAAGLTLLARVRGEGFELHTHPERILPETVDAS